MTSVDAELGLVALGAMLSPTTLTVSVLALILGDRPLRTGLWFLLGAFGVTLLIGVAAAFVLGNAAASPNASEPKTWVAIVDVAAGALVLWFAIRFLRAPKDPAKVASMVERMSGVASSPAIAIVGAGAMLANPGAFIPLALKDISQTNPSAAEYVVEWVAFTIVALLPLMAALVMLLVAREGTQRVLHRAREWLERHALTVAGVLLILLGAMLLRNGIAGLTA